MKKTKKAAKKHLRWRMICRDHAMQGRINMPDGSFKRSERNPDSMLNGYQVGRRR